MALDLSRALSFDRKWFVLMSLLAMMVIVKLVILLFTMMICIVMIAFIRVHEDMNLNIDMMI